MKRSIVLAQLLVILAITHQVHPAAIRDETIELQPPAADAASVFNGPVSEEQPHAEKLVAVEEKSDLDSAASSYYSGWGGRGLTGYSGWNNGYGGLGGGYGGLGGLYGGYGGLGGGYGGWNRGGLGGIGAVGYSGWGNNGGGGWGWRGGNGWAYGK